MPHAQPTLHLVCGKIAAGKSTLAARLASAPSTILIGKDRWLACLYGPEMRTVSDYVRYAARLRDAIAPHVERLLRIGTSVVLDFPANTLANRAWMRGMFERAGALHQLHYLDVPDHVCRSRLHERNAAGTHDFAVTDADFERITSYFTPPGDAEGFNVLRYPPS